MLKWLCCGVFFPFLSLRPSIQFLEELRLGLFKCKLSNLQNMYFWHIGDLTFQTNWSCIDSVNAISWSCPVAVV